MNEEQFTNTGARPLGDYSRGPDRQVGCSSSHSEVGAAGAWLELPDPKPRLGAALPAVPLTHLLLQVVKLYPLRLPGRPVLLFPLQIPIEYV